MKFLLILFTSICLLSYTGQAQLIYHKYPSISNVPFSTLDAYSYNEENIKSIINKVAKFQINKYGAHIPTKDWLVGTFFSSFVAAYSVTNDEWYLNIAYQWGEKSKWDIQKALHADDVCPGQTYLDLFFIKNDSSIYKTLDNKLAIYFDRDKILPGEKHSFDKKTYPLTGRNLWSWCDALYMAPPVYARMGKATGDIRYYEMLHRLYWDVVDYLYAPDEKLFYRNSKAQTKNDTTPNGKKVFWSRGNGWVFGGLARLIEFLPDTDTMKVKYIDLFQDMAYSLAKYQMEDGLWRSSINDPEWITTKETSGSAFFVYGMAKGINEGWLPKEYFAPIVLRGWSGLVGCVTPEGKLGYSQIVAGSPHEVRPHDNKDYAAGAFILAATELLKFNATEEMERISSSTFTPRLVATNAAWPLYSNENVIFQNHIFFASYVKRNGKTAYTAFSLENWSSAHARKEKILSTWNQSDFHNNAAFLPLKDGGILATYGKHGKTSNFYQRNITVPRWEECLLSEEKSTKVVTTEIGMAYQNLHRLSEENDRIYNFFRGNNFNPHFVFSDDDAKTWSEPIWIISLGENRSRRPYVKYVSNGKNRIDFIITDKKNKVYHMYYTKGVFYTSKDKKIRTIENLKTNPIQPKETTLLFDGRTNAGRGWVYDLDYDENEQPFAAFISSASSDIGTDMRYWIASFNGKKWNTEEIAYAGSNLYPREQHYAGGIALYPENSNQLVISANVNPIDGTPLPNNKYQLFKGVKEGTLWKWEQLTFDPVHDHLRPVIVRGENNALFWFTGQYNTYKDYHTDIMMSFEF